MILVTGYLTINTDKRAEVDALIETLVPLTEAEEGCVQYRYAADIVDPARINIVEQWESDEAMNAHMGSDHLAAFMAGVGEFIAGPVEIVRHDVSGSTKLI